MRTVGNGCFHGQADHQLGSQHILLHIPATAAMTTTTISTTSTINAIIIVQQNW